MGCLTLVGTKVFEPVSIFPGEPLVVLVSAGCADEVAGAIANSRSNWSRARRFSSRTMVGVTRSDRIGNAPVNCSSRIGQRWCEDESSRRKGTETDTDPLWRVPVGSIDFGFRCESRRRRLECGCYITFSFDLESEVMGFVGSIEGVDCWGYSRIHVALVSVQA